MNDKEKAAIKICAHNLMALRKSLHFTHMKLSEGFPDCEQMSKLEDSILQSIHWNEEVLATLAYQSGKELAEELGIKRFTNEYEGYRREWEAKKKRKDQ